MQTPPDSQIERLVQALAGVCTRGHDAERPCGAIAVNGPSLARARAGDEAAFRALTEPYRHEIEVHCYRILGSIQDAEDLVQETFLAAWRGLEGFEGRASVRTWLYRIATNRCLNALRDASRRPADTTGALALPPNRPEPTRVGDPLWLQPYPDALLDGVADDAPGPDQRYESREAVALAFVAGLQHLPPTQRALLVLRDVLGFRAAEAAEMLDLSEATVNSGLQRRALGPRDAAAVGRTRARPAASVHARTRARRALRRRLRERRRRHDRRVAHRRRLADDAAGAARVPGACRHRAVSLDGARRRPAGALPSGGHARQRPARLRLLRQGRRNAPSRTRRGSWCSLSRGTGSRQSRRSTTPPSSPVRAAADSARVTRRATRAA